jgi:hypothetical protein
LWETDGEIKSWGENSRVNGNDEVLVTANGTSLTLTMYAYAHRNDGTLDTTTFFQRFESFISEYKLRTDIFTTSYGAVQKKAALRMNSNLTFTESQYGSDMLSDPDGELRKLINSIALKYGNL